MIIGLYITRSDVLMKFDEMFKLITPLYNLREYKIPLKSMNEEWFVNQNSLSILGNVYGNAFINKIKIIYFGNETCENLIPTQKEIKKILLFCKRKGYQFSYVTPYVGPNGLERIKANLEFLENTTLIKDKIEVVFNDFGVLNVLQKYKKLIPVLGRLLVKTKRDPRYFSKDYCRNKEDVVTLKRVQKNQLEAISQGGLGIEEYQTLLKNNGVKRVSLDIYKNMSNIDNDAFPMDIYWPWTHVTSGRACQIAAINNPLLKHHPVNHLCRFECKRYRYVLKTTNNVISMHKGNALWMDSTHLIGEIKDTRFKRLIFQPYIPI